jgi:molybdopterin synthase sulfur carrier subunit
LVRVLLFGALRDVAGWREREVAAESLDALRRTLSAEDPDLGEALAGRGVQAAVDKTLTRGDTMLSAGAEVAFLPPMSGG